MRWDGRSSWVSSAGALSGGHMWIPREANRSSLCLMELPSSSSVNSWFVESVACLVDRTLTFPGSSPHAEAIVWDVAASW
jgi:hypothetical protein